MRNVLYSIFVILFGAAFVPATQVHTSQAQSRQTNLVTAIEAVARQAVPAVVHIEVTERQEIANPFLPFDDSGHILTNYHVVGRATDIKVLLADGRHFTGNSIETIGTDPKTDLALIQIVEKGPFPHLALGDSDKMEVGQGVVAIGHPRGLDQTVTQGIISAKHRAGISDPSSYQD